MNEQENNQKSVDVQVEEETPQEWHLHLRRGRRRHRSMVVRMLVLLAAILWVLFLVLVSR